MKVFLFVLSAVMVSLLICMIIASVDDCKSGHYETRSHVPESINVAMWAATKNLALGVATADKRTEIEVWVCDDK